jgi:hypothetical protein
MSQKILRLGGKYGEDYETRVPRRTLQVVGYTEHAVAALPLCGVQNMSFTIIYIATTTGITWSKGLFP